MKNGKGTFNTLDLGPRPLWQSTGGTLTRDDHALFLIRLDATVMVGLFDDLVRF